MTHGRERCGCDHPSALVEAADFSDMFPKFG
jgi:hypothetical protein